MNKVERRMRDLIGTSVGEYEIMKWIHSPTDPSRTRHSFLVRCSCGVEKMMNKHQLFHQDTRTNCGCVRIKALVGQTHGNLTVVKHLGRNNRNNQVYECRCKCGKVKNHTAYYIMYDTRNKDSCNSCSDLYGHNKIPDSGGARNQWMRSYKSAALKRNIKWLLRDSEMLMIGRQNCFYCDQEPQLIKYQHPHNFKVNGLARVDIKLKEYSVDNCVPCCKKCSKYWGPYS